jgi:hypothetical protein
MGLETLRSGVYDVIELQYDALVVVCVNQQEAGK